MAAFVDMALWGSSKVIQTWMERSKQIPRQRKFQQSFGLSR